MHDAPWVMTCAGTLGDHAPFFALARALQDRGVPSVLAINDAMLPRARALGLRAVPFGETFGPREARRHAWTYDHWRHPHAQAALSPALAPVIASECRQLARLCRERGARGLLAPVQVPHGRIAAELARVPWVSVALMPAALATDDVAPRDDATRALDRRFSEFFDALRRSLGLAPLHDDARRHLVSARGLLACSREFFAPDPEVHPGIDATGFWWPDVTTPADWSPDRALREFMRRSPAPLVLSFSSLPLEAPHAVLSRYRDAAASLGLPLLVIAGWAGFDRAQVADARDAAPVHVVDSAPHDWVFPRASAVICHGGIGSVGRALQAGTPLLIEPYGNDQMFNALRVVQLGAGAAVHPHRATADGIARVLSDKVLSRAARERAAELARRLAHEQGLARACERLREWHPARGATAGRPQA